MKYSQPFSFLLSPSSFLPHPLSFQTSPLLVLVGSTRPAKLDGVRAALDAVAAIDARFKRASIEGVDVTSVAPAMPMTERAVVAGARARAEALLERARAAKNGPIGLAVGVEGGLERLQHGESRGDSQWTLRTWAVVTDGTIWGYGGGGAILLPDALAREVLAGRELGDVVDHIVGAPVRGTRGAWGILTRDLIDRRDAFRSAVIAALAPFYNQALYNPALRPLTDS